MIAMTPASGGGLVNGPRVRAQTAGEQRPAIGDAVADHPDAVRGQRVGPGVEERRRGYRHRLDREAPSGTGRSPSVDDLLGWHRSVEGAEDLPAFGVHPRSDQVWPVGVAVGQPRRYLDERVEDRDGYYLSVVRQRQPLDGGDPDTEPGERAGAGGHRVAIDSTGRQAVAGEERLQLAR